MKAANTACYRFLAPCGSVLFLSPLCCFFFWSFLPLSVFIISRMNKSCFFSLLVFTRKLVKVFEYFQLSFCVVFSSFSCYVVLADDYLANELVTIDALLVRCPQCSGFIVSFLGLLCDSLLFIFSFGCVCGF